MISHYIPLLEDEQEVLLRMIEGQDAYVEVVDWGYHSNPQITAGDKRIQIRFQLEFNKPVNFAIPVSTLKLRLRLRDGRIVFEDVKSVVYGKQPLNVQAGLMLDLAWDIALAKIDDEFKDIFMPGIKGKKVMEIKDGQVVKDS